MKSSVVSYPDRGKYGKSSYRGNCSGHIIKDMLNFLKPKLFVDPSMGSGTSKDVAAEFPGMEYYGFDLHSGFNLLKDRIIERIPREADYLFWHPPYGSMVLYSGNVWGDKPHPDDLSRCGTKEEFLEKLQMALYNIYEATRRGGMASVLIGDVRKNGDYWSIQSDIIKMSPFKLDGIVVKQQHNCVSDRTVYSGRFIPVTHEYLLNFKKDAVIVSILDCAVNTSKSLVALNNATWRAVIEWSLRKLGGKASLDEIYAAIAENAQEKTRINPNWTAKVRQTLQKYASNVERGVWELRAAA